MKRLRIKQISESAFSVQGHGVHTAFVETVRALEKRTDTKVYSNARRVRVDVTHIHTIGLYSLAFLLFGSGKKVVSAHVVPASFVGSLVLAKYWLPLASWYVKWFYNRADLVIAVSDATKRELQALGVKRPIEVMYNMVDTSRYIPARTAKSAARKKLGIAEDAFVIIGAGQVQPRKRVDSMVTAAKACPELTFMWVGGMPFGKVAADNAKMQRMMDRAPKNMLFPGIVPLEDIKQYYWAADVFFLPSDQETFGLVVVEGAAAGLPVVLRDIPDYTETFSDVALLVSEKDFAPTFRRLHTDHAYYENLKRKAKKLAERFDSGRSADRLMELYEELV
jgi:1,2-diacylglycerol-3-alpha-glucose alpha-1,2-galactosyltransferase